MRPIPSSAVAFVAAHEGFRAKAYLCPANVWTIGYGHTENVKQGDSCSKAEATIWLADDLQFAARKLYAAVKPARLEALTENQWAALLSFAFNLGFSPKWTIAKRLNAGELALVPSELLRFSNANGKRIEGLYKRRVDECALWGKDDPTLDAAPVSLMETRAVGATPPTPTPAKASPLLTGALGVAATVPVAAQQVAQAVAPYAEHSAVVGKILALMATLGAAAAILVLALNWLKHREAAR